MCSKIFSDCVKDFFYREEVVSFGAMRFDFGAIRFYFDAISFRFGAMSCRSAARRFTQMKQISQIVFVFVNLSVQSE